MVQTDRQTEKNFQFTRFIADAGRLDECVRGEITSHNVQRTIKLLLILSKSKTKFKTVSNSYKLQVFFLCLHFPSQIVVMDT